MVQNVTNSHGIIVTTTALGANYCPNGVLIPEHHLVDRHCPRKRPRAQVLRRGLCWNKDARGKGKSSRRFEGREDVVRGLLTLLLACVEIRQQDT